jgi:osmoprotectant transport system ATP-binding protein
MIRFSGVAKSWDGRRVVGPLSFEVARGEFVALLGGSGCGKTTTLKMVNGLIEPDEGAVVVDGGPASGEALWALRRRIGYVFQEVGLFPHMTVAENIAVGPRLAGWSRAKMADRVGELLDLVALPREIAARAPSALSGGQRQRVGVARALGAGPAVMLMDEPFGALDPGTRNALGRDYRALHERLGLTTMMVTHDVTEALLLADRVIVMDAGRFVADGTPGELLSDSATPTIRALMETPLRQAERIGALSRGMAHG